MEAGNAALGLRHTWPAITGAWGLTTTTVEDQLRLLTDLTSERSPLDAPARAWELALMQHIQPGQDWGVTAAADPGARPAVKNGWLPAGPHGQWVINSIGVVTLAGHRLLIACQRRPARPEPRRSARSLWACRRATGTRPRWRSAVSGTAHLSPP